MPEKKPGSGSDEFDFPFKEFIEDLESPEDFAPTEIRKKGLSDTLSGTFEDRLKILKEAIDEIDCQIGIRKDLHKSSQKWLKQSRNWLTKGLIKFEAWEFGYKPSVDFRRTSLERELLGVYRESRAQRQRAFSDIAVLKRERRNLVMEYRSLKATGKMVSPERSD